jgi:hypothetical protein
MSWVHEIKRDKLHEDLEDAPVRLYNLKEVD